MKALITAVLLALSEGPQARVEGLDLVLPEAPVRYGLAAKYPDDKGLAGDPDVILFEDYEVENLEALRARGWDWNRKSGEGVYSLSSDPSIVFDGKKTLAKTTREGRTGAIMPYDLPSPEDGPVYHRVYTKIPKDAPPFRIMGITGVKDGWPTWKAIGSAGMPADGTNYYCVTLTLGRHKGHSLAPQWYPYHADQKGPWGSNWNVDLNVPTDRWFCLEIMVRLTTPGKQPGTEDCFRDGEIRMWIDGREVYARTDIRFRTVPGLKTRMIFDQVYSSRKFKKTATIYADNRVVARRYVGPRVRERREPTDAASAARPEPRKIDTRGIASRYPGDKGIGNDQDVLLFDDFEISGLSALEEKGWVPRHGPGLWKDGTGEKPGWKYFEIEDAPGTAFAGRKCLKKTAVRKRFGSKATHDLPEGAEVVFQRAYVRLSKHLPGEKVRLMGVTGAAEGEPAYPVFGAETPRSDGTGPFWVVLLLGNWEKDGEIRNRNLRLELKKTDDHFLMPATVNALPVDRWFCLEMMTGLNTPGRADGELRVWLDGREVFRHTGLTFRSTGSVKIRAVNEQCRIDAFTFDRDGTYRVDNRVVARKYVGPFRPSEE